PKYLTDQHLIAEYNEILMLFGYVKKYPTIDISKIPKNYTLGKGHILFFKNKLLYLKNRHELIKTEMKKRNFLSAKTINLKEFRKKLINNFSAKKEDIKIIKKRLIEKINKKSKFYRYYGKVETKKFLINLIKNAKV
ncbi:MAG: pyrimidine dimer DNA glycosylase/endonuclease V, partial [archaeon]